MASTFTPNKNLEQPANGDYLNDWNVPVNADWAAIDNAFGGATTISVTGASGTNNLSLTQVQPPSIKFTGTLSNDLVYTIPANAGGFWFVLNSTTGNHTIVISSLTGGGTTVGIPQGLMTLVVCDGTNIRFGGGGFGAMSVGGLATFFAGANIGPASLPASNAVGYLGLPQTIKNTNYTTVISDTGTQLYHSSGTPHTYTIDSNADVPYAIGTIIGMYNAAGSAPLTIAITSDTLRWLPSNATGPRTVTGPGKAICEKVLATEWWITGLNIS